MSHFGSYQQTCPLLKPIRNFRFIISSLQQRHFTASSFLRLPFVQRQTVGTFTVTMEGHLPCCVTKYVALQSFTFSRSALFDFLISKSLNHSISHHFIGTERARKEDYGQTFYGHRFLLSSQNRKSVLSFRERNYQRPQHMS